MPWCAWAVLAQHKRFFPTQAPPSAPLATAPSHPPPPSLTTKSAGPQVCELAKRIKDRSAAAGRGGAGGQSDFSPAFLWLLRDFQLTLAAGGSGQRPLSPAAYLEEVLADVRGGGGADEANRNQARGRERRGGRKRGSRPRRELLPPYSLPAPQTPNPA